MIRLNNNAELEEMMDIWYEGSVTAHGFVDAKYWASQRNDMKLKYFPLAENYIIRNETEIIGFVSMVDNYLAALFVNALYQGMGYGKELLDYVKDQYDFIQLKVYKKNFRAADFYLRNSFVVKKELLDENTKEEEYLMEWYKH
ncbi:GNAT family N-acetyltransferase [Alkalicoccus daliensis]|uniref:Putative acetyltransferase n=1 Tax=Alkalicoccus daliensis TaxID=745820 RepID=A0A1H0JWS2_9BACI|nr:GNAT family N-acetyltransferase [Alkalicoccus daliensis]SDO48084.1 putative acetyltransferase [Alkalicoccus daliensis]